ncbi:katanin p60 ATPase-containing subunit A-like 2 [Culicoides brevitarsis]|uniref:katanin p60 ATPase-containing subunit A-like 2 n=1 Tax=Culicoides brevitarsis TaxID=469753 RepID=UPI00307C6490
MNFEQDRKAVYERRKNLLYLIHQYLVDVGLAKTSNALQQESDLSKDYQVCDNVDLDTMYMEFCSYYKLKFGKNPKIVKRADQEVEKDQKVGRRSTPKVSSLTVDNEKSKNKRDVTPVRSLNEAMTVSSIGGNGDFQVVSPKQSSNNNKKSIAVCLTKPLLSCFDNFSAEWRDMAEIICRDLIQKDYGYTWDSVRGADNAKAVLYEGVIVPLEYPELFSMNVKSWKSVLMHGPPGTGKTMLAKALCSEVKGKLSFFNVAASTVTSKWRGESEKLIRVLFDVAKLYAPSIIFIDEIDGLASQRDSINDHEATKRFKNEFLTLIDGVGSEDSAGVFLLANTNLPWDIDPAFLRRFERKILIELPDAKDRLEMFKTNLPEIETWDEYCCNQIADSTGYFTGDEIRIACKEASMQLIRQNIQRCKDKTQIRKGIRFEDLMTAIGQIRPASKYLMQKHIEWNKAFGNQL